MDKVEKYALVAVTLIALLFVVGTINAIYCTIVYFDTPWIDVPMHCHLTGNK